jgi:hypothetical protein
MGDVTTQPGRQPAWGVATTRSNVISWKTRAFTAFSSKLVEAMGFAIRRIPEPFNPTILTKRLSNFYIIILGKQYD